MSLAKSTSFVFTAAAIAAGALLLARGQSSAKTPYAPIEYKAVPLTPDALTSASAQQKVLDDNGKDGWQLVVFTPVSMVFRR